MPRRLLAWIAISTLLLGAQGCGDDDDTGTADGDADADTDADADSDGDAGWTIEDVDTDDAARQTSMSVSSDGQIGIAYFTMHDHEIGPCPIADTGEMIADDLRYVQGTPGAMSAPERVDEPFFVNGPKGMTVRFSGATPYIGTMGGPIEPTRQNYCGVNDVVLWSKAGGAWTMSTVAANSADAPPYPPECDIDGASTFGWVVGRFTALAIAPSGEMAMAWRDNHAGGVLQRDDTVRADLEFATGGPAGWTLGTIDCGLGGGDYTVLNFEPSGEFVAAWFNPESAGVGEDAHEGVWIARHAEPGWDKFRLFQGTAGVGVGMAVASDGKIGVSWFQQQSLRYAEIAPGQPLSSAVKVTANDAASDAGKYSSLAFLPDGRPVIASYRCQRYGSDDDSCEPNYDGPVLSYPTGAIDEPWRNEVIDPSGDGNCGTDTQVGVLPDGRIVVAYTCSSFRDDVGEFVASLRLATRGAL